MVERPPEAGETLATPLEQAGEIGRCSSQLSFLHASLLNSRATMMRAKQPVHRAPRDKLSREGPRLTENLTLQAQLSRINKDKKPQRSRNGKGTKLTFD